MVTVNSDELDDKSKPPVVQQKGRFKVTSENVDLEKVTEVTLVLMFLLLFRLDVYSPSLFRWFHLQYYKRVTACRLVILRSAHMCQ